MKNFDEYKPKHSRCNKDNPNFIQIKSKCKGNCSSYRHYVDEGCCSSESKRKNICIHLPQASYTFCSTSFLSNNFLQSDLSLARYQNSSKIFPTFFLSCTVLKVYPENTFFGRLHHQVKPCPVKEVE